MLQNNQENASYRRSLAPSLDEQQAVIDEVAKGDATFNNVLTGMLNRFEEVTQFNKKHPTRAYGPIIIKMYKYLKLNSLSSDAVSSTLLIILSTSDKFDLLIAFFISPLLN